MDRWLASFILGGIFSLFFTTQPSTFYINLIIILALLFLSLKKARYFVAICIGSAWVLFNGLSYHDIWRVNELIEEKVHQSAHLVVFNIIDIPQYQPSNVKINAEVTSINNQILIKPINVRLNWRVTKKNKQRLLNLGQSQQWQALVKMKPAYGMANPSGFAYQRWLREKQLHATGYVLNKKYQSIKRLSKDHSFRQKLFDHLSFLLQNSQFKGVLLALMFGERSEITKKQWQVFQKTSTSHLIAISGLHIGLVFFISLFMLKLLTRLCISTVSYCYMSNGHFHSVIQYNLHAILLVLALLSASFYAYLANFSMPTLRALIMIMLYVSTQLFQFHLSKTRLILLTVVVILCVEPLAFISASFWLSLSAVTCIFIVLWRSQHYRHALSKRLSIASISYLRFVSVKMANNLTTKFEHRLYQFITVLSIQLMITITMLPIAALLYQKVSLTAFFANMLAVPWLSLLVIPLTLLFAIFGMISLWLSASLSLILQPLAELISTLLLLIWRYLTWLSQFSLSDISVSKLLWQTVTFVIALIIISYLIKRLKLLFFLGLYSLALMSVNFLRYPPSWQLTVLDVGQGLSVLLEKQGEVFLYDTGASFPSGFNFAQSVIFPQLVSSGTDSIAYLFLSHDDNDHNGGEQILIDHFKVNKVYSSYKKTANHLPCIQGRKIYWQGLTIEVLWPKTIKETQSLEAHLSVSDNNSSCVLMISDGLNKVLLSGDIEEVVERELVEQYGERLNADILVAPHHGSKTSSSQTFINQVTPELVIFSTGYLNRWKMPHKEVITRYKDYNVKMLNTAQVGAITTQFYTVDAGRQFKIQTVRENVWPFWFVN